MTAHLALYAGSLTQVDGLNEELAAMTRRGQESGKNPEFAQLTRRLGFEYNGMLLQSSTSRAAGRRPSRIRRVAPRWLLPWLSPSAQSGRGRRPSTQSVHCGASAA